TTTTMTTATRSTMTNQVDLAGQSPSGVHRQHQVESESLRRTTDEQLKPRSPSPAMLASSSFSVSSSTSMTDEEFVDFGELEDEYEEFYLIGHQETDSDRPSNLSRTAFRRKVAEAEEKEDDKDSVVDSTTSDSEDSSLA